MTTALDCRNEKERDRLGRIVRDLWMSWAEKQPNTKPSWLVPYDQLSEADKEADRVIGYGMMVEFRAGTAGERLQHERLKQIALNLRQQLHGFRELFDENDWPSGEAIQAYDDFVGAAYLDNATDGIVYDGSGSVDFDELGCGRCGGLGVVPTEGHESVSGRQEKPCPHCSR